MRYSLLLLTGLAAAIPAEASAERWVVYSREEGEIRSYDADLLSRNEGRVTVWDSVRLAANPEADSRAFLTIDCGARTYRVFATHLYLNGREISHALTVPNDEPVRAGTRIARLAEAVCQR